MAKLAAFLRTIDTLNNLFGKAVSFLFIPLMVITSFEVVSRYVFNRPTIWAWDVNIQLFGAIIVVGGGYTLLNDQHVRVDVLINLFPRRLRIFLDLLTSLLFFFCIGVLLWQSGLAGWESLRTREVYTSLLEPPIYPLKILIFIAVVLLFLQGIARFIRNLLSLIKRDKEGA